MSGPALFTSPEANILSLATDKSGNVYAGSAPNGIVYKITPDGKSSVLYDTPEPNVSALATDSLGNVYAGTSATGTVYRIAPDGTAKRLLGRSAPGIQSLKTDANDAVYAVSGSTVYKINTDDSVQSYVADADEQFLSLALDPASSAVYAGTATVGSVYKIGAAGGERPARRLPVYRPRHRGPLALGDHRLVGGCARRSKCHSPDALRRCRAP